MSDYEDYGRYHYEKKDDSMEYNESSNGYYDYEPRNNKKRGGGMKKFAKLVASALVFGVIAGGTIAGINVAKDRFIPNSLSKVEVAEATTQDESKEIGTTGSGQEIQATDVSDIVDQVMPSVVSITSTVLKNNYFYGTQESSGAGSGFIIAKQNNKLYIATNNHVVEGASSLKVGFADNTSADAELVGTDKDSDLAVISVKADSISKETASKIKIAVLGSSDDLKVGQTVIAIGNALGYGQSVTTGVISAKDREVTFTDGSMILLQTDAAINPGNSGGVLINTKGEVIGINNAKLEDTSVEGMGYAIPMSSAKSLLTDIMNAKTIKSGDQAYLGITGRNITADYSSALGIPTGIYVSEVGEKSPAEAAGIQAGDVITGFDGSKVSTMTALQSKLQRKEAGTKVEIVVQRVNQNGKYEEQTLKVTLGKRSDFIDESEDSQNNSQNNDQNNNQNNGQDNGNYGNGNYGNGNYGNDNSGNYYTNPFDYFFGNGSGNSYYYGN